MLAMAYPPSAVPELQVLARHAEQLHHHRQPRVVAHDDQRQHELVPGRDELHHAHRAEDRPESGSTTWRSCRKWLAPSISAPRRDRGDVRHEIAQHEDANTCPEAAPTRIRAANVLTRLRSISSRTGAPGWRSSASSSIPGSRSRRSGQRHLQPGEEVSGAQRKAERKRGDGRRYEDAVGHGRMTCRQASIQFSDAAAASARRRGVELDVRLKLTTTIR